MPLRNFFRPLRFFPVIALLSATVNLHAQGHYNGGSFNPNDYFIAAESGWVFSLYYSHSQLDFFNANGEKTDVIDISQDTPLSVEIGQNITTNSIIPMLIYFGKGRILNARWGVLALPIINSPNANVVLDFYLGQSNVGNQTININTFGLGDLYLQPLWLTWDKNKFSTTFSYGLWMPTGKYEFNDPENVGLGYWSHNLRLASRYKPTARYSLTAAATFEFNSQQKEADITEAPHFTLDYGASYNFTMGHEIGLFGFGTWQMGDDRGTDVDLFKDRVYGLGAYGSYWFIPGKFGMLGRLSTNFGAENRVAGWAFQIGINYLLFKAPQNP